MKRLTLKKLREVYNAGLKGKDDVAFLLHW